MTRRLQVSEKTVALREQLIVEALETKQPTKGIVLAPQSSQIIGVAPVDGGKNGVVMAVFFIDDNFIQRISNILNTDVGLVVDNKITASTIDRESDYENLFQGSSFVAMETFSGSINLVYGDGSQVRLFAKPLIINEQTLGTVVVAQPIQELIEGLNNLRILLFIFAGVIAAISLILLYGIIRNFSQPIIKLVDATRRVKSGEFNYRLDNLHNFIRDEITELGENFNDMTGRLDEVYTNMEGLVQERTIELEETLDELAVARDQALDASRAKSTFLANMSHELRTPLNAIIGYSEMLVEDAQMDGNSSIENNLSKILSSGKHLLQLINDILDLSKIEAGKMEIFLETFDVNLLISDTATTISPLIDKNNNKLVINISENIGEMHSDITKVRQILLNLLSNSSKFTENGNINLNVHREFIDKQEFVLYKVVDTGIGMTKEQIDRLFQAFIQADSSTTKNYGGTGLGLAICKHYALMLGGDILVNSSEGEGTTFTVKLPLISEGKEQTAQADEKKLTDEKISMASSNGGSQSNGQCMVLIIDDDPAAQDLMQRYLEKENLNTIVASTGEEGLRMAQELKPDVITLDVILPDIDGWSVLSKLKSDPELKDIPVIVISMLGDKNTGYAMGASEYMVKPVDREQLARTLNRYRCESTTCKVLVVEDDQVTREMMHSLISREGWESSEAENGKVALEKLTIDIPNLIILDLMMPEMDGFEFLTKLRVNDTWRDIPVIVLTAKDITSEDQTQLIGNVEEIYQKSDYSKDHLLDHICTLVLKNQI